MSLPQVTLNLSGERFRVVYRLVGDEAEARAKAKDISLEQTVEFPDDLVPAGSIRDQIVGQIESLTPLDERHYQAVISYAIEVSGLELTQFVNVVFGNISIKPGIRVEQLELPESLLGHFKGPRFGRKGLREYLNVPTRPLLCTALKPMGLGPRDLAKLAYQFARGGIDMIKDDHGLADQSFCPFEERVKRCAEAVQRANAETGYKCIYMPNVTAPFNQIEDKVMFAKQAGAGGLLISPAITGLDVMRYLADDDRVGLPIMSHPAFQGSYVVNPDFGISQFALYGQITRLAGADAVIYPNYGGRFAFTRPDCEAIAAGTALPMGNIKPIFPTPAGGMSLKTVPEAARIYGREVIYLIGGGLHRHGPDLVENCRYFKSLVENI